MLTEAPIPIAILPSQLQFSHRSSNSHRASLRLKALRVPPPGHDSVQGSTQGSRVHMLYDLGQAYPEYLVTYRR